MATAQRPSGAGAPILLANYGKTNVPPADGDLDFDGDVDLTDVALMLQHYGQTCP